MATPVSGVNNWLTLNGHPLDFAPDADNLAVQATDHNANELRITRFAPDHLEIRVDGERLETERYGLWTWLPKGFAGLYEVTVTAPKQSVYTTRVRVLPNLISQKRYEWMIKGIGDFSADLLFQLHSPAVERMNMAEMEQLQSPVRDYRLIESLIGELEKSIRQIAHMPNQGLLSQKERRQWHELHAFADNVMPMPGTAIALPTYRHRLPATLPAEWMVERQTATYDVYENRLLKQFLWRQLLPRLDELEKRAGQEIKRRKQNLSIIRLNKWEDTESVRIAELEQVIAHCRQLQRQVIGWGNLPFLQQVSMMALRNVPTQVLQKHPAYGRFYQVYLRFQQELKRGLNSEGFLTQIAMRKLSELYEMWSVFQLTRILLNFLRAWGYELVTNQGFFRLDDEMFHFEVDRQASITLQRGEKRILIRYEPLYPPANNLPEGLVCAWNYQRTPDLVLEVWQEKEPQNILIFDAKYKAISKRGRETFLEEDLQKMSSYYNEIRWKTRHNRLTTRIVSSAYIIYPGEVLEHQHEVGALPLVPGRKPEQGVLLALIDLLQAAQAT